MSRKDFISDQLVDMRSQLRDSYTSYHQNRIARETEKQNQDAVTEPAEKTSVAVPVAPVAPVVPEEKYLPSMRRADDRFADTKERRELEGRILHDLAAIDCEREKLQKKLEELERFAGVLETSRQEITDGNVSKIGKNYFAASGRWSAFEDRYEKSLTAEVSPAGYDRKGSWIVAAAILLGSLIVAFALMKSFSV